MDVVTLGELLVDMFPATPGQRLAEVLAFIPKPGGAPANVAVAAHRLGASAAFIGKVGDEAFGHHLIEVLRHEGVETRGIRVDTEARTTLAFIAKPDPNSAEFVFYRNPGADTRLRPDELDRDLLHTARAFHFGSLSLTHEPVRSATHAAIQIARAGGALISYDVNYRPSLWDAPADALTQAQALLPQVDLLKVNEVELALLAGLPIGKAIEDDAATLAEAAAQLLAQGPALCVVTLGERGSFFMSEAGQGYVAPFEVETVDAVGCGDTFIAGLLCRLVMDGDWRCRLTPERLSAALRYANAAGALTATKQGVIPALPTAAAVVAFLAAQGRPI